MLRIRHVSLVVMLGLLFAPAAVLAQDKPKAEDILDNYVKATGGKAAYEKLHSVVASGTFELTAQGIKGTVKVFNAEPDKSYMVIDVPGIGKIEQGSNGEVFWENSALQGARLLTGDEKAAAKREATFNSEVNWRKLFKKVELAGEDKVDGKAAYKVLLTPNEGAVVTRYYDKDSGLLIKDVETLNTPMGVITTETSISDYKKYEGVMYPCRSKQKVAGNEIQIVFDKVEFNATIDKNRFDLPDAIKKLTDKK